MSTKTAQPRTNGKTPLAQPAPPEAKPLSRRRLATTADLARLLVDGMRELADDRLPLAKADSMSKMADKLIGVVEVECRHGTKAGGKRRPLPLVAEEEEAADDAS